MYVHKILHTCDAIPLNNTATMKSGSRELVFVMKRHTHCREAKDMYARYHGNYGNRREEAALAIPTAFRYFKTCQRT